MTRVHDYSWTLYIFTWVKIRHFLLLIMLKGCLSSLENIILISELSETQCMLINPITPLLTSQRVLIPLRKRNTLIDLTKNSEATLNSEIQRLLVLNFLHLPSSWETFSDALNHKNLLLPICFFENNYFHRILWMSTYYRALDLSGEKGIMNSKYTDEEWVILGDGTNRDVECMVGTTHVRGPSGILKDTQIPPILRDGVTHKNKYEPTTQGT